MTLHYAAGPPTRARGIDRGLEGDQWKVEGRERGVGEGSTDVVVVVVRYFNKDEDRSKLGEIP